MFTVMPTTEVVLSRGLYVAIAHGFAIWDAIILAAASEAGCRILLSEDMQDGFTWGGVHREPVRHVTTQAALRTA